MEPTLILRRELGLSAPEVGVALLHQQTSSAPVQRVGM
jgi:hypothetical protein